ncbi:MAG: hypothetical protein AAF530_10090 [Pseudomonadota bacterium]
MSPQHTKQETCWQRPAVKGAVVFGVLYGVPAFAMWGLAHIAEKATETRLIV